MKNRSASFSLFKTTICIAFVFSGVWSAEAADSSSPYGTPQSSEEVEAPNSANSSDIQELFHSAYWDLCMADHEYEGHRLQAVYHLQIFVRHNPFGITKTGPKYQYKDKLSHHTSIEYMEDAKQNLQKFLALINVAPEGNRHRVSEAINEINIALEVGKKDHDKDGKSEKSDNPKESKITPFGTLQ